MRHPLYPLFDTVLGDLEPFAATVIIFAARSAILLLFLIVIYSQDGLHYEIENSDEYDSHQAS
jgi:hypothetical protein